MKVLTIGSDRKLFEAGSDVRERIIEYGTLFEELHIIVFSKQKFQIPKSKLQINSPPMPRLRRAGKIQISKNVFLYPTHSQSKFFYMWDAYRIGRKIIGNWKLEIGNCVLSAQDPFEAGLAGWLLKRKFNIPLQLQIHTDFLSPYFRTESLINRMRFFLARFLIPRADCLRVVSERIKDSVISNFQFPISKIYLLPIFIDVEKIKNALVTVDLHKKYPQFGFIILMASRLTEEKNIEMAIDALQNLVKKYPNILLVLVGEGPETKNYTLHITHYTLQRNVIIEGWTAEIFSYYKTADAFLLLSNYEGYGRTAIEAMAAGCPVVMTDVGVAGEIVKNGENGIVVPVGDQKALLDAIQEMYENRKKRIEMSVRAKENIQNSLYKNKEEYLQLYKQSFERCLQYIKK